MNLEERIHEDRGILGKAINFIAPFRYRVFGEHFQDAKKYNSVQELFEDYAHSPEATKHLEERLAYHLQHARKENRVLKFAGGVTDSIDKILALGRMIPGAGYLAKIPSAAIEWPIKIANSLFYRGKTGEKKFLRDMGHELLTEIPYLGDVIDIGNRYSMRVDKYAARTAADRFVNEIRAKGVQAAPRATEAEIRRSRRGLVKIDQELTGETAVPQAAAA